MLFNRTAIIRVWLVVFGLFALFESPMTVATGVLLLFVGGAALTIMLVLLKEVPSTIAPMTAPDPLLATLPSAHLAPKSWPNSGFRNSTHRGARGERRSSRNR
jgi:hypothetical protein